MGKTLNTLIIEDHQEDALLLVEELRRGGFDVQFERVETPEALGEALDRRRWDLVVSDFQLPTFSAVDALASIRARRLDMPFLVVSSTVPAELAVELVRSGAHDFIPKQRLARLVPAVERELREALLRDERARLAARLVASDKLAAFGQLAADVSHQLNNPLAALIANLEFVAQDLDAIEKALADDRPALARRVSETHSSLEDARKAAERVGAIVKNLQAFSRPEDPEGQLIAAAEPSAPPAEAPSAPRRGRILVVDDEPMIATLIRRMLSPQHEVVALTRAGEAIDKIRAGERFDAILCDMMMPEMTGEELHAQLLAIAPEQAARFVFVTGGVTGPARERLARLPNAILEKPFTPRALRALIASLVK